MGGVDADLASLIRASNTNFSAISSQDAALASGLTQLPSTLEQTSETLGKVQKFAAQTGPTLAALQPFARNLEPALRATQPLLRDTVSTIKDQLRPFSVAVQPLASTLAPAAANLKTATPELNSTVGVLNALFNELAYTRGSSKPYLFWGAWLSHIANSLTSMQDANGPIVQAQFMATCPGLQLLETALIHSVPSLASLLALLNAPNYATIDSSFCPAAGL